MRYNPPPNWPQPPADWTPPPGWEPDPYWPPPPSGWELWVADDETIISPFRAASAQTQYMAAQSMQPWYRRTRYVVLLTIFVFPVGLALLWKRTDWSVQRRSIITAAVALLLIIGLANPQKQPTTTAGPNPVAAGGVISSSPTPTASPAALPATAAPTVAAPTIAVTTPPVIVTTTPAPVYTPPAPVHTQPAPVHTTKAPAPPKPVKTNPPAKQSCHPLTASTNKCYTAGEFCSAGEHNTSGIAANGEAIKCVEDSSDTRWRWVKA